MKLSRFTPAELFEIRTPVWGGRKVGLNVKKIRQHNEVRITFKDQEGRLVYPNPLYISGEAAQGYPVEPVKRYPDVKLYIIPIEDLEPLERI